MFLVSMVNYWRIGQFVVVSDVNDPGVVYILFLFVGISLLVFGLFDKSHWSYLINIFGSNITIISLLYILSLSDSINRFIIAMQIPLVFIYVDLLDWLKYRRNEKAVSYGSDRQDD